MQCTLHIQDGPNERKWKNSFWKPTQGGSSSLLRWKAFLERQRPTLTSFRLVLSCILQLWLSHADHPPLDSATFMCQHLIYICVLFNYTNSVSSRQHT